MMRRQDLPDLRSLRRVAISQLGNKDTDDVDEEQHVHLVTIEMHHFSTKIVNYRHSNPKSSLTLMSTIALGIFLYRFCYF
jgi:hypothetical protein